MIPDLSSNKFERQERLSVWNQRIIEESSVLIVGVGGTGGEVAKNLALLGIGNLILIDLDTIEYSNLNRQLLFSENDVGKYKAEIAKKFIIKRYNPDINIAAYTSTVQDIPFRVFTEIDVIAGCVDNFLARQYLNEIAIELKIPFIDSATDGYFGQVQCIKSKKTACLACDSPTPPNETQVLSAPCTIVGTPRIKEHCAWKALYKFYSIHDREPDENSVKDILELTDLANELAKEHNFGNFERKELANLILFHVPSLITVSAVTSGIQSQEIVKSLFIKKFSEFKIDDQNYLKSLIETKRFRIPDLTIYSALTGTINSFNLTRDTNCLVCGDYSIFHKDPVLIEVNPNSKCEIIFKILKNNFKKDYIGFRGEIVIKKNDIISDTLENGDRMIASSLEDDGELRVEIKYQGKT
ncbi:MAG: ThiF family adenylyltransferase [Candidatus Heimdallarchaeota archaeon]|nr:ThiF family adenylyltransferase [Candidatus Heimdallarchaeota archaeon]